MSQHIYLDFYFDRDEVAISYRQNVYTGIGYLFYPRPWHFVVECEAPAQRYYQVIA